MSFSSTFRWLRALGLMIAAGLVAAPLSWAQPTDSVPLSAKVVSLVGSARYETNRANWNDLREGVRLSAGAAIQTALDNSTTDIGFVSSDRAGHGIVRIFPNSLVKLTRLNLKQSGPARMRDIGLNVLAGQIRVTVDGASDYDFEIIGGGLPVRLKIPRAAAGPQETVFVFGPPGNLTVLKGAVKATTESGKEKLVRAGRQLLRGTEKVTRVPADAPELQLDKL